jgi:thymidylate kinase
MEQEPPQFYEAVCRAYRELAKRYPYRIRIIDATGSIEEIEEEIWDVISARFGHLARMIPSARRSRRS